MSTTTDPRFTGKDNYGRPKSDYVAKLAAMTDEELTAEAESKIWLSAYASNNHRSDYHWHVDAIYDECEKREDKGIYKRAYDAVKRQCGF